MRVTRGNVQAMTMRAHRAAFRAGFSGEPLHVHAGSSSYGIAWDISQGVEGQRRPDWLAGVIFGRTTREAYDTLHTVAVTLENLNDRNAS